MIDKEPPPQYACVYLNFIVLNRKAAYFSIHRMQLDLKFSFKSFQSQGRLLIYESKQAI